MRQEPEKRKNKNMAARELKAMGWLLLFLGMVIIFGTLYASSNIFTGKGQAPEIFEIQKEQAKLPQKISQEIAESINEMIQEQFGQIIPAGLAARFLNLISWSIFAGIMLFGGSQISTLGIKLLK